jgi:uncharacterized protein YaeQ
MDRHHYGTHALTVARHPSETDERMMVRILAYALHAGETLIFGRGLSTDDEPDLWQKDLTGAIEHWIDVGQPDERRLMKACGRSARVWVYSYSSTSAIWWSQIAGKLDRAKNLGVFQIAPADSQALAKFAQRSMQLQCTIQDGEIWINSGGETLSVRLSCLKEAAPS